MAGNENSGGFRPTAPQNNPSNISATGGAGGSGQPSRYISGMPYGQGQELMAQQSGAKMQSTGAASAPEVAPMAPATPVTPLFAPTERPNEPVTHGTDAGPGADSSVLNLPAINPNAVQDSTGNLIRAMYANDPQNEDLRLIVKSLDEAGR